MLDDLVEQCEASAEYLRAVKAETGEQDAQFSLASVRLIRAAAEIRSLREQVAKLEEAYAESEKASDAAWTEGHKAALAQVAKERAGIVVFVRAMLSTLTMPTTMTPSGAVHWPSKPSRTRNRNR